MNYDLSATALAMSKLPADPPASPASTRSAWGWAPRVVQAAAAGVMGHVADAVNAFGSAAAMSMEADPLARAAVGTQAARAGAERGRREIDSGAAMTSDVGESFRAVRRDAMPDPLTAGKAEQLVFGVAEPMLKLVGAGVTLGPLGLIGAATELGVQQADDLREQGVDFETRTKVGTLAAGANLAGVALPMAGSTLARTGALYLAGGPGAYVAQQAATQEILRRADYAQIAEQFDPLDPTGLAIASLVPLPFAAFGAARNIKAARAGKAAAAAAEASPVAPVEAAPVVAPEAVDAAMVHNLTVQRDALVAAARPVVASIEAEVAAGRGPEIPSTLAPERVEVMEAPARPVQADPITSALDAMGPGLRPEVARAVEAYRAAEAGDMAPMARLSDAEANIVQGLRETVESARRVTELVRRVSEALGREDPTATAADRTADAVEGMRRVTEAQLTDTAVDLAKPKPDAVLQSVADRVRVLEDDRPVRISDDGRAITAADEMAEARRLAAEGTDAELGALDADLLKVAAECALSMGAAA